MLIKQNKIPVKHILLLGILPTFLKKIIYRLKGYKIGKNVSFGFGSVIIGQHINIGDNVQIGHLTILIANNITIDNYASIGSLTYLNLEKLIIGEDSRIRENVKIAGIKTRNSILEIGERSAILQGTVINPTERINIGHDTGIGGNCSIFTHGSWLPEIDGYPVSFAPITIGNNVWIAWNVFIMPGIKIGDHVVIGANSHVNKNIPSNCIATGNPITVKVPNFPIPLKGNLREQNISSIIKSFSEYMNEYDFKVIKQKIDDNNSYRLKINKKSKVYYIYYLSTSNLIDIDFHKNSLFIINKYPANKIISMNSMIVHINNKTRKGSNKIGEEFVKYISRFGFRFKRID